MVKLENIITGFLNVNCYLVYHEDTREAYIVDPGAQADKIARRIQDLGLLPRGVLLTHGHVDHIQAVPEITEKFHIPLWMHPAEKSLYSSPENALMPYLPAVQGLPDPVADLPPIEGIELKVLHTPGHTLGGVCYYFPRDNFALTGDTLFRGTYGRTDFPGGSYSQIASSITKILFALPEDTRIYPGHDAATTIGLEKQTQVF